MKALDEKTLLSLLDDCMFEYETCEEIPVASYRLYGKIANCLEPSKYNTILLCEAIKDLNIAMSMIPSEKQDNTFIAISFINYLDEIKEIGYCMPRLFISSQGIKFTGLEDGSKVSSSSETAFEAIVKSVFGYDKFVYYQVTDTINNLQRIFMILHSTAEYFNLI